MDKTIENYVDNITLGDIIANQIEALDTANNNGDILNIVALSNTINVLRDVRKIYIEMYSNDPALMD